MFAATSGARPRALKLVGRLTAGLVTLWLVALVLGTLGFGSIAGIDLPRIGGHDGKPSDRSAAARDAEKRAAAERAANPAPRATETPGVRLTNRGPASHGGPQRMSHRNGQSGARNGTGIGSGGSTPSRTPAATGPSTAATPSTPTPAATATPQPAYGNPAHGNSTHTQATPPGSSSSDPGSRSQATTAPGQTGTTPQPAPGSGRNEHAPPKG